MQQLFFCLFGYAYNLPAMIDTGVLFADREVCGYSTPQT